MLLRVTNGITAVAKFKLPPYVKTFVYSLMKVIYDVSEDIILLASVLYQ